MVFNFGYPIAGVVERLPAAVGREDQLGPPIGRIRSSLEVTQPLQIAHELRGGRQAQLRPERHVRQPDAVDAHVAEDVQMGLTQVRVTMLAGGSEELGPKLAE